ncbi:hypothetical protein [Coleofasciculus sp. H7-2]
MKQISRDRDFKDTLITPVGVFEVMQAIAKTEGSLSHPETV